MKLFTEILAEARREWNKLTVEQLKEFEKVVRGSKSISKEYLQILIDTIQLGITSGEVLDEILNGPSSRIKSIAAQYGGTPAIYDEIKKLAAKCKPELKGLPQLMTAEDYNNVISGKRDIGDITLDLETEKGRERCARQYASLVTAIASKYRGSGLDWNSLISAGYLGLTKAMSDYHRPDEFVDMEDGLDKEAKAEVKKQKNMTFKQYAGWRIRFQILNDINELSRTVRISQYEYEKNKAAGNTKGNFNTVSVDQTLDDEGQTLVDRMTAFSNDNDAFKGDTKAQWDKVYKLIDAKFSVRTASVFYKYFGLRGYKQMSGVEIAKEMGITGAAVSMYIKHIITFLKSDKKTVNLLTDLLSMYSESLIMTHTAQTIMDAMITDNVFIMLQECTRWTNRKVFNNAMGGAISQLSESGKDFIINCLENDINYIDEHYDGNRSFVVNFLESVYPTEYIRRKSDVDLITMMNELSENFKIHNIVAE
jgi:DNA-directed RNA polymerase specialized sigma subunit